MFVDAFGGISKALYRFFKLILKAFHCLFEAFLTFQGFLRHLNALFFRPFKAFRGLLKLFEFLAPFKASKILEKT